MTAVLAPALVSVFLAACTRNRIEHLSILPTAPPLVEREVKGSVLGEDPEHQVISLGDMSAKLTYSPSLEYASRELRLVVSLSRKVMFDRVIDSDAATSIALVGTHTTHNPLVVVKTYTGGTHCCTVSKIVDVESANDVHVREDNWGDGDFSIRRGTAIRDPAFIGKEAAAPYAFGPFSGTAGIVRVERYERGELRNAAKAYPDLVLADARERLTDYLHEGAGDRPIGKSSLAGYLIDMCRVGQCNEGWQKVRDVYGTDYDGYFDQLKKIIVAYTAQPEP